MPAPAGEDRGRLPSALRDYILGKAITKMPREVDRLIADQEWNDAEISRGPLTTRKRVRSRK